MSGTPPSVVLASASPSRRLLLANAGVTFTVEPAPVDEAEVKAALRAEQASPSAVAETLAELKALHVSRRHPGALVIGADQMLECEGVWLDKPQSMDQAAEHLRLLSGKPHVLLSSVCVVQAGQRLWHHNEGARLTMRRFGEDFISSYLQKIGDIALQSVGAYQLEGLGAQLFAKVEGDYFTILGLPLLPLLSFLRNHRVVPQ